MPAPSVVDAPVRDVADIADFHERVGDPPPRRGGKSHFSPQQQIRQLDGVGSDAARFAALSVLVTERAESTADIADEPGDR